MPNLTLKGIPDDLHAQLKREAEANFRSLDQEALARIELSFKVQSALNTKRDQKWIDEALGSGPEEPLTRVEMDKVRDRVLRRPKTA